MPPPTHPDVAATAADGHTFGMKTAISLPDDLFADADAFARRTGRSRSQLYADALREYLQRYDEDRITEQLDRVCAAIGSQEDPALAEAARRTLAREPW